MDNKADIFQNSQINNTINGLFHPNPYNLLIQNNPVIGPNQFQNNFQNPNMNLMQNINQNNEVGQNVPKKIRKRTTKKESDVRNYKCNYCDKSYLSYPALYTHCKQKHNDTNNHSGKGRGRPKKEIIQNMLEKSLYDPLTLAYFKKEDRAGKTEIEKINECIKNSFKFIYIGEEGKEDNLKKLKDRKMKVYTKIEDHPFLYKFLLDKHDIEQKYEDILTPTDLVLINYLNKMSVYCNEKFYEKLIIFVTLFREHANIINQDKVEKDKEFTQFKEAEDVPESSNEFITDFLFPDEQEIEFGLTKEEAIDMTRNLCNWMYTNNFTCSKLFLLDKEN